MRLELFVGDLKKSIDFYKKVIQLELLSQSDMSAMFKVQNLKLLLTKESYINNSHYFGDMTPARKGLGVEIIFVVDDIQSLYRHISNMPIELESKLTDQSWGMTDFRLADPDGYYLRITSPKMS